MNNLSFNNDEFINNCVKNLQPIEKKQKINLKKLPLNEEYLPEYVLKNSAKYKFLLDYGEM